MGSTVFDLEGNAHIVDTKTIENKGDQTQSLIGPFKQGIRKGFVQSTLRVTDSTGGTINYTIADEEDTSAILLHLGEEGEYPIYPKQVQSFTIEYDVPSYADKFGLNLLVKTNIGNIKYESDKFDRFDYTHIYRFDLGKGNTFFKRLTNKYRITMIGFKGDVKYEKNNIEVIAPSSLKRKELQTNTIILEAKWRKYWAMILTTLAGGALRPLIESLVRSIIK